MKWLFAAIASVPFLLPAQQQQQVEQQQQGEEYTPQQIAEQLAEDERLFQEAKEMFNPWYAGPLLTGGAGMMPPGQANVQPYLFVTENYGGWDEDRSNVKIPKRIILNPSINGFQFGVTSWMDIALTIQSFTQWQENKSATSFGDSTASVGFPIAKQGLWVPAIKAIYTVTFPTGRYQELSPHKFGLDGVGAGSYQSRFGLNISKLVFWQRLHPMNLRATFTYTIPAPVPVRGFNVYGGGYGTRGTVSVGNSGTANAAFEYSFTQRWVLAMDLVYTWQSRTTFRGKVGTTATGAPAAVGAPSNDQFSLAPAIEYNPTPNLGFLGGVWFDVYGRNTTKFISGIVSFTYTFSW